MPMYNPDDFPVEAPRAVNRAPLTNMNHSYNEVPVQLANHACNSCRSRKRKCDKLLPTCSLCSRKSLSCSYTNSTTSQSLTPPPPYGPGGTSQHQTPNFPAVFFLDSKIFQQSQLEIPAIDMPIPTYVLELIGEFGNWRGIASNFFDTIHRWMPIISKTRLYGHLLNPLVPRRTDVALLILCMRLCTMFPTEGVPMSLTPEYLATKRLHAEMERAGGFSTQVLQSGVLIALHEFGHAIYPAAYLSIGACARYGISSGMDGTGTSQMKAPYNWIEEEERKRVWWAVLILDRCVNLGNPSRSLATQEPSPSSILPAGDEEWDSGAVSPSDTFTLSSPTTLRMGRFARFAQAIYLLGRVLKHVSDQTDDHEFLHEEAIQLRRTIEALVLLTDIEGSQSRRLEFCTQTALSYSGLLRLQDRFNSLPMDPTDTGRWKSGMAIADGVAVEAARLAQMFCVSSSPIPVDLVSPFILDLFYNARVIWGERIRETGDEKAIRAATNLTDVMAGLNTRWRASGVYLEIVKACEMSYCG